MLEYGLSKPVNRRSFLEASAAGLATLAVPIKGTWACAELQSDEQVQTLTPNLAVFKGTICAGVLLNGPEALLIDCGDTSTFEWARNARIKVKQVLATHHHREQVAALLGACQGVDLLVPAAEEKYFTDVAAYWNAPGSRWHIYNQHPHHWMLPKSIPVSRTLSMGESFTWGTATIKALETPGHTDGSMTYLVDVDGLRVAFCGHLFHGPGQVPDLYCLQKGFQRGQRRISDYHGFLGAREILKESINRVLAERPDLVVTSSGGVIENPEAALRLLVDRLDAVYDNYVSTSALRHYFPELFEEFAGRPDHFPFRPHLTPPAYLRHVGTSWILVSENRAAFVMDCGSHQVIEAIEKMLAAGEINRVEGLWITHYHDDHVDAVPKFLDKFGCPCYAVGPVAEVITRPLAWRLPCISPSVVKVDRVLADGESFGWHEFRITAYEFPGQTLYHGGLLVEKEAERLLFVGDSFTPAGIDDYCIQNRNFLHENSGFLRCLDLIARLQPTHMFNCHVDLAFTFSPEDCQAISQRLRQRRDLLQAMLPWRDPHFGMDEFWVRCDPYEQEVSPGEKAKFDVVVFNHLAETLEVRLQAVLPTDWTGNSLPGAMKTWKSWPQLMVSSRQEQKLSMEITVPKSASPGRFVIMVDVAIPEETPAPCVLCGFTEAIIAVKA
ncbi:MAG: MBL fold metallo-hydrolase [Thermogutta sp.]